MARIEFDKDKPIIVVMVRIKNKGEVRDLKMALDTGATFCMVPWKVAEVLDLQPEMSKDKIDMTTASGIVTVPKVTADSIVVSNKVVSNVELLVHDLPPKSYVDGLIGLSFLKNFSLYINFKEGYFELE